MPLDAGWGQSNMNKTAHASPEYKTPLCGVSTLATLGQVGIKSHDVVWTHHLYDAASSAVCSISGLLSWSIHNWQCRTRQREWCIYSSKFSGTRVHWVSLMTRSTFSVLARDENRRECSGKHPNSFHFNIYITSFIHLSRELYDTTNLIQFVVPLLLFKLGLRRFLYAFSCCPFASCLASYNRRLFSQLFNTAPARCTWIVVCAGAMRRCVRRV
jgi:hypothetical protein